jgi:hypothetical protein
MAASYLLAWVILAHVSIILLLPLYMASLEGLGLDRAGAAHTASFKRLQEYQACLK